MMPHGASVDVDRRKLDAGRWIGAIETPASGFDYLLHREGWS